MANQWALLIGINQYTALQPLMYAQADAVALRNFFVDELGIPIDQCTLLTDMSAAIEPYAHPPFRKEITSQLQDFCREKVQPGDLLWVFFSGYGLASEGQDYWMPIDANPMKLAETAIAVATVFDILKTAKTEELLLVLDMNRSQGAVGHQNIGQQTLSLAKDFGIPTLLSCQPDQYSHETMAIRHGLFTKALLEGLRYHGCVTVSQLVAYLGDRVPELSQHHWRPIQNPVTVIPPASKFMMVVPSEGIANLPITESAADMRNSAAFAGAGTSNLAAETNAVDTESTAPYPSRATSASVSTPSVVRSTPTAQMTSTAQPTSTVQTTQKSELPPTTGAIIHQPNRSSDRESGGLWWKGILVVILTSLVGALVGVFIRYQPDLFRGLDGEERATPAPTTANSAAVSNASAEENSEASQESGSTVLDNGESALQRAEAAIAAGRYGEARAWLTQVPPDQQTDTYNDLLQQANSEVAKAATRNQAVLNDARQIIQPASASLFNDAIQQARQVPPDDPYYEQAQADIERWSRVILDLAEGRAAGGDIAGAVAAAQLVPEDRPDVYRLAQQRIDIWQRQIENQQLIQQAQTSLQPGQASSFQDAIKALQQISPDQPGYNTAQERIAQWSQDILAIARARAAQGRLPEAIAAAELVPQDTVAYEQAQQEIQRWQGQL